MSDWIEWKWTPEKPYPETLDTRVWVRFDDLKSDMPTSVGAWVRGTANSWKEETGLFFYIPKITAYKLAD